MRFSFKILLFSKKTKEGILILSVLSTPPPLHALVQELVNENVHLTTLIFYFFVPNPCSYFKHVHYFQGILM